VVFLILQFKTNKLMEKKIGLVLSGGGTKGISEAGVLQFLEEKTSLQKLLQEQVQVLL
jgi:predicted acylesterase/phospholipase RssA